MEKIQTAEEFIHNFIMKNHKPHSLNDRGNAGSNTEMLMKEFAKLHVEAALKSASDSTKQISESALLYDFEKEIINAYPLENIK